MQQILSRFDLSTRQGRAKAYLDYLWTDHAYLRLGFRNAHKVSGELWRANQPWPFQLTQWKARGVRTVVNLRGGLNSSTHTLERAACERLGLTLIDFNINSREAPTCAQVLGARALFETLAYPAMMHCKSGADRAGIMSVLYAHFRLGQPIAQAKDQLSPKYLHVKQGLTGVLDFVFERYLEQVEPTGVSFVDWVQSPAYDPKALKAEFRANWWGTLLTEKLARRE